MNDHFLIDDKPVAVIFNLHKNGLFFPYIEYNNERIRVPLLLDQYQVNNCIIALQKIPKIHKNIDVLKLVIAGCAKTIMSNRFGL